MGKQILVISKKNLDPTEFDGNFDEFCKLIDKHGTYMDRDQAETDETHCQIIPYVLVKRKEFFDDLYFLYERLKGGKETRLHAKRSIGIGGHIDRPAKELGPLSLNIFASAKRELVEELDLGIEEAKVLVPQVYDGFNAFRYMIYDPSNAVGRVHLGILMKYEISADGKDPMPKEIDKIDGRMTYSSTIRDNVFNKSLELENWSTKAMEML